MADLDIETDDATGTPEWLTLAEAAERSGKSVRTLRRAVKEGLIVGQREDARTAPWYVRWDSVAEFYGSIGPVTESEPTSPAGILPVSQLSEWAEVFRQEAAQFRAERDRALEDAAHWRAEALRVEALLSKRQRRRLRELRSTDQEATT